MPTEPQTKQDCDLEALIRSINASIAEGDRVGTVTPDELRRSITEVRSQLVQAKLKSGLIDKA